MEMFQKIHLLHEVEDPSIHTCFRSSLRSGGIGWLKQSRHDKPSLGPKKGPHGGEVDYAILKKFLLKCSLHLHLHRSTWEREMFRTNDIVIYTRPVPEQEDSGEAPASCRCTVARSMGNGLYLIVTLEKSAYGPVGTALTDQNGAFMVLATPKAGSAQDTSTHAVQARANAQNDKDLAQNDMSSRGRRGGRRARNRSLSPSTSPHAVHSPAAQPVPASSPVPHGGCEYETVPTGQVLAADIAADVAALVVAAPSTSVLAHPATAAQSPAVRSSSRSSKGVGGVVFRAVQSENQDPSTQGCAKKQKMATGN